MRKFFNVLVILILCAGMSACTKIKDAEESSLTAAPVITSVSSESSPSTALETQTETSPSSALPESQSAPATSPQAESAPVTQITTTAPITTKVTVTEGLSLAQIGKLLEQNGVCTRQALLDTVNTYDFSYYSLISALGSDPNRAFKLEGYLYPDTYEFYLNQKPEDVLGKFLRNTENKMTDDTRQQASAMGYTMDQILTMASIIEKESASHAQMKTVASVFYNRLSAGQKLQSDATINYMEWYVMPLLTGDVSRYNAYYNTYKCAALPAGPICNPGKDAIEAALYPEQTEYYYFVSDTAGNYYYAKTYEEHLANLKTAGVSVPAQ